MEIIPGYVHIICGPMMSGKSRTIFEVIDQLKYREIPYFLFQPNIVGRNLDNVISRFSDKKIQSMSVKNPRDIFKHIDVHGCVRPTCIIIDESNFFPAELLDVVKLLSFYKFTVFVFGLELDANGNTFNAMGNVLALADKVHKITAVCTKCKKTATKTELFTKPDDFDENNIVLENEGNVFGSLCNDCFYADPVRAKKMNEIYQKLKD